MLTKEIIKQRIAKNKSQLSSLGVDLIGLFGSYVRGEQKKGSDIDILISFKKDNETFNNFMEITYFLDELFRNEKVEIVTKNGLSPYIGEQILKEVEYV